jgi:hypothetical protein
MPHQATQDINPLIRGHRCIRSIYRPKKKGKSPALPRRCKRLVETSIDAYINTISFVSWSFCFYPGVQSVLIVHRSHPDQIFGQMHSSFTSDVATAVFSITPNSTNKRTERSCPRCRNMGSPTIWHGVHQYLLLTTITEGPPIE